MTENRRHRAQHVFRAALAREASERAAFVRASCGKDAALQREVASLLAAHEQAGSLAARPAIHASDESAAPAASGLRPGDRFGPYQITDRLGWTSGSRRRSKVRPLRWISRNHRR